MKKLTLLFVLMSIYTCLIAQDHKAKIKQTAQLLLAATLKEDYSTTLDYTYPKFLQLHGGKDSVLNTIKEGLRKMEEQNMKLVIESGHFGEPSDEVKVDSLIYCVIPEKLRIKINGSTYITTSSLIGISSDNGNSWTFLEGASRLGLKSLLPGIDKLNIPDDTGPTLIKDDK
jgi:hypothetical protein